MSAIDRRVKSPVSIVRRSANGKLGPMSATYAAQITCPPDCALRGSGCYAEGGATRFSTRQRNGVAGALDAITIARLEAAGIDALPTQGALDLRVHVVGDCATDEAAAIVGAAMVRYQTRTGRRAYTYTHAWRTVDRDSWAGASVMASCESVSDIADAYARGYAAAVVVPNHDAKARGIVACPNQTHGKHCADCRLCTNADALLARGVSIAFAVHGTGARQAAAKLR